MKRNWLSFFVNGLNYERAKVDKKKETRFKDERPLSLKDSLLSIFKL